MSKVLMLAAIGEAVTGLLLVLFPALVAGLLLGTDLGGPGLIVARVAGIALIGLGLACWPGPAQLGMVVYSGLVTLCLGYLGAIGSATGVLLWPAVILHGVLTVLLLRDLTGRKQSG